MRKFLLFAIAVSLGTIAFAAWPPDPLPQATCDFFGYPNWNNRSVKGCLTCPVYENGHKVTCESVAAANGGVIDRDCCWLNTPQGANLDSTLGNCYTNGCVLGPNPWSVKCICKLNCAMSDPSNECYNVCNTYIHPNKPPVPPNLQCLEYDPNSGVTAPNGGNGSNGSNSNNSGNTSNKNKIHKKNTPKKPIAPAPSNPVSEKQTPIQKALQTSSKNTAK